jgi:hypothetical protein
MSIASKLLSAAGGSLNKLYIDDCFSCFNYTGNGGTQTINNGIDLAGKGGLVWNKSRSVTNNNFLADTLRGATNLLISNSTTASFSASPDIVTGFNSNGFTLGSNGSVNTSGMSSVSWTFRRTPRFFDVVTFVGDGTSTQRVPHSLNCEPGMIVVKSVNQTSGWNVYHTSMGISKYAVLQTTDIFTTLSNVWGQSSPTTGDFGITNSVINSGDTAVAYLFANDTIEDSVIKCGIFTSNINGLDINLGWEAQYVLIKQATSSSSSPNTNNWYIWDTSRGFINGNASVALQANTTSIEAAVGFISPIANGFRLNTSQLNSGNDFIYMAIRRSNKPPVVGTEVYNAISRTGTGAAATVTGVGFAPDMVMAKCRDSTRFTMLADRLRGVGVYLNTTTTSSDISDINAISSYGMDGLSLSNDSVNGAINGNTNTFINYFFKRAVGVFDEVCWNADGGTNQRIIHNLTVAPELIITKNRNAGGVWYSWHSSLDLTQYLQLSATNAIATNGASLWGTSATATDFGQNSSGSGTGYSGNTMVGYLFASKSGISKVFSYTGNGTSQTIDCGFTTGARFFLVKSTSVAGSWWVYDSVRGISAPADPALQLNSTAAEITTADAVDPHVSGVIVNQEATCSINANGVSYIGLAFA